MMKNNIPETILIIGTLITAYAIYLLWTVGAILFIGIAFIVLGLFLAKTS